MKYLNKNMFDANTLLLSYAKCKGQYRTHVWYPKIYATFTDTNIVLIL